MASLYSFTTNEMSGELNKSKNIFLMKMLKLEKITQEQYDEMSQYAMLVREKGLLGKLFDKVFKHSDSTAVYTIVKVLE